MNMTYGGHPAESAELRGLAAERGLILLEDAAHGLGGSQDGGTWGPSGSPAPSASSRTRIFPIGEGGMLVTDDDDLAARARLLRSHGMTTLTWDRHRGHAGGYDVVEPGFNYRIDEPRATLAIAGWRGWTPTTRRRAAAAGLYRERLERPRGHHPDVEPPPREMWSADHSSPPCSTRASIGMPSGSGSGRRGVQTSMHYPPVHRFSAYRSEAELPLTEEYAARASPCRSSRRSPRSRSSWS